MGERTARITAADFVTPPEFAHLGLAASAAGRIGGVHLELTADALGTRLSSCYAQIPLRALALSLGETEPALVYLVNPTAGLMDGDAQLVQADVGARSRVLITGQSATRIHPAVQGFCTQHWHISVERGAIAIVLPGPGIPFAGARCYQRARIDLAEGASLVWGDIWFSGRYARGAASEGFRFDTLVQDVQIRRAGRLVYRDRFRWKGPWDAETANWHFGSFPAYGGLWISGSFPSDQVVMAKKMKTAWFTTASNDTVLRALGPAEQLTRLVVDTAFQAAGLLEGRPDRPWLRGNHPLAPVHWFNG